MIFGRKGFSISFVVMIIVVVAAVAFVAGTNYQIPAPPSVAKAPLVEVPQETATQETTATEQAQTTNETTTQTTTQTTTESTAPVVETKPKITTNHVVISEVKFGGDEFVELYNPTDSDVVMTGWWIGFYFPFSNWDSPQPNAYTPIKIGATIKSHGYFLIGGRGYSTTSDAVLSTDTSKLILSEAGGLAIFSKDIRGMTAADAKAQKVDAVGWVVSDNVVEGSAVKVADPTSSSISLERKPGESEPKGGNYVDTENNENDFAVRSSSEPQSSASAVEP